VVLTKRGDAIEIAVGDQSGAAPSDVLIVTYTRSAVSSIGRGENAGRQLTEFNIVRSVRKLGRFDGRAQQYRADITALPKDATHAAVLVQVQDQGPILGAASIAVH
jgi:hypothetical protein